MAEMIRIALVKDEWTPFFKNLSGGKVNKTLKTVSYRVANKVSQQLRKASSQWKSIQSSIKVKKTSSGAKIDMALKGIYLDRMEPHYVALKRGRKVTAWVNKHKPLRMKTGKSRVRYGPKGGVIGGALYVTPTPWIDAPMTKGLNATNRIMNQEVNKLLRNVS